jgi:hypothetical protein
MAQKGNAVLVRKSEENLPLQRPRRSWEVNNKKFLNKYRI